MACRLSCAGDAQDKHQLHWPRPSGLVCGASPRGCGAHQGVAPRSWLRNHLGSVLHRACGTDPRWLCHLQGWFGARIGYATISDRCSLPSNPTIGDGYVRVPHRPPLSGPPRETEPITKAPPSRTGQYEALPPDEAYALAQRLDIHHTPKHGSRLNIAEIELSCMTKQCLGRRIADLDTLNQELHAWQDATNTDQRQVDRQFTTTDARVKLRHLYPTLQALQSASRGPVTSAGVTSAGRPGGGRRSGRPGSTAGWNRRS